MNKQELRRSLLKIRQSIPAPQWQEKSQQLCTHLQNSPQFQQAKTILAYFSFRQEPDLSFLWTSTPEKIWGFPRCQGESLTWHQWHPPQPRVKNSYGIWEPLEKAPLIVPSEVDLILVPAIACTPFGYRLGYGGGFYDRMLSTPPWSHKLTIGVIFDFAQFPQLPTEPWDIPLTGVCTETGYSTITNPKFD